MSLSRPRILVAGGGIAGLACAFELAKAGADVRLWEAATRGGGKVLSRALGGLCVELGPDSFLTAKPDCLELVRELGLDGGLVPTGPGSRAVHVFSRGRLRRLPDGLLLSAAPRPIPFLRSDLLPILPKLRMGLELLVPRGSGAEESIAAFCRRRFGEEALHVLFGPVLAGIFAGDPERLSLRSTFPKLAELEAERGSVLRGLWSSRRRPPPAGGRGGVGGGLSAFMTLREGLARLTDALAARLPAGCLELNRPVERLERLPSGRLRVASPAATEETEAAVLAVPAYAAAAALKGLDPELAGLLEGIPFASTATVSLLYGTDSAPAIAGAGFVVDRRESATLTAATFTHNKFPERVPAGQALVRAFVGGAGREAELRRDDGAMIAAVRADLRHICGLDAEPREVLVHRWDRSSPQYEVGHAARLEAISSRLGRLPGVVLTGCSYLGVGLPDCIRSGREAARRVLAGLGGIA